MPWRLLLHPLHSTPELHRHGGGGPVLSETGHLPMSGQQPLQVHPARLGPRRQLPHGLGLALPILPALKPIGYEMSEPTRVGEMVARKEEATSVQQAQR